MGSNKVFCIGFNKTGTSSLHSLFNQMDLDSLHNTIWTEISQYASEPSFDAFFSSHLCFSDGEMADIKRIDSAFPDAKYVLNVRELHAWLSSRIKWVYRKYPESTKGPMAQEYFKDAHAAIRTWIKRRQAYHAYVLKYFENRQEDLLIVNVCSEKNWESKVANFLGHKAELEGIHSNKMGMKKMSADKKQFLEEKLLEVDSILQELNIEKDEWQSEVLITNIPHSDLPIKELRQNLSHLTSKWEVVK